MRLPGKPNTASKTEARAQAFRLSGISRICYGFQQKKRLQPEASILQNACYFFLRDAAKASAARPSSAATSAGSGTTMVPAMSSTMLPPSERKSTLSK